MGTGRGWEVQLKLPTLFLYFYFSSPVSSRHCGFPLAQSRDRRRTDSLPTYQKVKRTSSRAISHHPYESEHLTGVLFSSEKGSSETTIPKTRRPSRCLQQESCCMSYRRKSPFSTSFRCFGTTATCAYWLEYGNTEQLTVTSSSMATLFSFLASY